MPAGTWSKLWWVRWIELANNQLHFPLTRYNMLVLSQHLQSRIAQPQKMWMTASTIQTMRMTTVLMALNLLPKSRRKISSSLRVAERQQPPRMWEGKLAGKKRSRQNCVVSGLTARAVTTVAKTRGVGLPMGRMNFRKRRVSAVNTLRQFAKISLIILRSVLMASDASSSTPRLMCAIVRSILTWCRITLVTRRWDFSRT